MEVFYYTYLAILGLILGSFFNVVGLRVTVGESIVKPRSHCPKCGHVLSAFELIPVFSYVFLGGRCKSCKTKLSILYPIVELATGFLFFYAAYHIGFEKELIVALTLISLLVIIFVSDIHYMLIPDKLLLFFGPILLIERIIIPHGSYVSMVIGAALGFFIPFLIMVISYQVLKKDGMGFGDVKLFFVLGFVLGWQGLLIAFFLSTLYGAVVGVILLATKIKSRKDPIPFGPFIVLGTLTTYFYGKEIIDWYLGLM